MLYLATPYAHENPDVMRKRYETSCRASAKLMSSGTVVFNPLANTVPAVELGGLELEHDEFIAIDLEILRRCDELLVLGLENWRQSVGVNRGIFEAIILKKPVTLIGEADIENLPTIPATATTYLTSRILHEKIEKDN